MAEDNVSSLLIIDPDIVEDEEDDSTPLSVLLPTVIYVHVYLLKVSTRQMKSSGMTPEVISLDHNAYVYEAMMTLLRYSVHHLPVLKKISLLVLSKRPISALRISKLAVIGKQHLPATKYRRPESAFRTSKDSFVRLVNEDANAHMVGTYLQ